MKHDSTIQHTVSTSRRKLVTGGLAVTAALCLGGPAFGSSNLSKQLAEGVTMQSIQFKNNDIRMAGNIYLPKGFDPNRKYPAIISVHPGGGVKEQTAGLYAQRLAEQGEPRTRVPRQGRYLLALVE